VRLGGRIDSSRPQPEDHAITLSLKQFIASLDDEAATVGADGVRRAKSLGLDVAAVMLPGEVLTEDRVSRMNALWDLLDEREALVKAGSVDEPEMFEPDEEIWTDSKVSWAQISPSVRSYPKGRI
jgi:hypothetical protein